jgi:hypothetical protein
MLYTWACPRRPIGTSLGLDRDENSYLSMTCMFNMDFVNMVAAKTHITAQFEVDSMFFVLPLKRPVLLNVVSNPRRITSTNTSHSPSSWTTALCWADPVESRMTVIPNNLGVGRVGNPLTNKETLSSTLPVNYLLLVNNNEKWQKRLQVRINTLWICSTNGL